MPDQNIVLVGFMGTGKSTVGEILAERLTRRHVDTDDLIEERAGMSIPEIFEEFGEPRFREIERAVVRDISSSEGLIITAGGGVVLDPDNMADFERHGVVVCLGATLDVIMERVSAQDNRPLLNVDERREKAHRLLTERAPLYDAVPHKIDTSLLAPGAVAERIIEIYESASS